MPDRPTPGELIRQTRLARGETARSLAGRTGIDPSYLSRIELNKMPVYGPSRVALAAALDLREADLVSDEERRRHLAAIGLSEDDIEAAKAAAPAGVQ